MHMPKRVQSTIRRSVCLTLIAGTCLSVMCPAVQSADSSSSGVQPETGMSFDSISFAINPVRGVIDAKARAGWIWREGSTHRLQLVGDVEVILADSYFSARSASLWLRKIGEQDGRDQYQVYAVFEDMRSADGTITMQAQRLPVRGVIEIDRAISIGLDARFDHPPKQIGRASCRERV